MHMGLGLYQLEKVYFDGQIDNLKSQDSRIKEFNRLEERYNIQKTFADKVLWTWNKIRLITQGYSSIYLILLTCYRYKPYPTLWIDVMSLRMLC